MFYDNNSYYVMCIVQNGLADQPDPSSSTAPCLESASHGVIEHFETQNGNLLDSQTNYSVAHVI